MTLFRKHCNDVTRSQVAHLEQKVTIKAKQFFFFGGGAFAVLGPCLGPYTTRQ